MCGIAGFLDEKRRWDDGRLNAAAAEMAATLRHRGPDASATWADARAGIAFGHTRLSIVDLSAAGGQPMTSSCGRCVITYNGEVYNAGELREELERSGRRFRGHSDTEVIVEGCAAWGVAETVRRLIGMFAFALWDHTEGALTLVRDRLGIKPLYWGRQDGRLVFASELKALKPLPGWHAEIDRQALASFMRYSYVPAPASIYKRIFKLRPGTMLRVAAGKEPEITAYWSLPLPAEPEASHPRELSDEDAADGLEELLFDAVKRRLVADVPLGAFLSGGIDSSTVVALMQRASNKPVRTFSIGFHEDVYNEAQHAKEVAAHLGTDHTEQYVTPGEAREVIPRLPSIYDEPFADSSQIPTLLVSAMTREHVTVALSGDGGDELFAGYNRYVQGLRLARLRAMAPRPLRAMAGRALTALPPQGWDRLYRAVPAAMRPRLAGDKMHKLASVLPEDDIGYYRKLVSQWDPAWTLVDGAREPQDIGSDRALRARFTDPVAWMQYLDTLTYLPDDILTKVDRASMAVSLEARVPILDHRVVEFAWSLPHHQKIRNGTSKWLLRQVLHRLVPRQIVERPKMGFGVPIDSWLRGPLKEWAEDLLAESELAKDGILHAAPIREKWAEHLSGRRNWQYLLWNVLMFQAWLRGEKHGQGATTAG